MLNRTLSLRKALLSMLALTLLLCLIVVSQQIVQAAGTQATGTPQDFAAIDAHIAAQMQELRIPGVALAIVQGDQLLYLQGYGVADPSGRA